MKDLIYACIFNDRSTHSLSLSHYTPSFPFSHIHTHANTLSLTRSLHTLLPLLPQSIMSVLTVGLKYGLETPQICSTNITHSKTRKQLKWKKKKSRVPLARNMEHNFMKIIMINISIIMKYQHNYYNSHEKQLCKNFITYFPTFSPFTKIVPDRLPYN